MMSTGHRNTIDFERAARQVGRCRDRPAGNTPHAASGGAGLPCADPSPAGRGPSLLDLARRHCARLGLSGGERAAFAAAIRAVVEDGDACMVGPFAATGRRYRIERRACAVAIAAGQGRLELPIGDALALADLLARGAGNLVSLQARLVAAGVASRDPLTA
jgi:hypothetical protein